MNDVPIQFAGTRLHASGRGTLWWPEARLLCVSDLHLGKSERMARRAGTTLPPYDTADTLNRLADEVLRYDPAVVLCLGDSFDDPAALAALRPDDLAALAHLQAGRDWIWVEGNHDTGATPPGGQVVEVWRSGPLVFRHIASDPRDTPVTGEISGHYHPKARIRTRARTVTRAAFLHDAHRLILPAFGTYTGGMFCDMPPLTTLMGANARAIVTGPTPRALPMPR